MWRLEYAVRPKVGTSTPETEGEDLKTPAVCGDYVEPAYCTVNKLEICLLVKVRHSPSHKILM
jgi:hypothetical protein